MGDIVCIIYTAKAGIVNNDIITLCPPLLLKETDQMIRLAIPFVNHRPFDLTIQPLTDPLCQHGLLGYIIVPAARSEERRVGKEGRSGVAAVGRKKRAD